MISGMTFYGQSPFTVTPFDVSSAAPLALVAQLPEDEQEWVAALYLLNRDTGLEEVVYISANGMVTTQTDSPANTHFPGALQSAFRLSENVISGGSLQARGLPSSGDIEIINLDGFLNQYLADPYTWSGQRADIYIGKVRMSITEGEIAFSTFNRISRMVIADRPTSRDNVVHIKTTDNRAKIERPIQRRIYRGLGAAWRSDGASSIAAIDDARALDRSQVPMTATSYTRTTGAAPDGGGHMIFGKQNWWWLQINRNSTGTTGNPTTIQGAGATILIDSGASFDTDDQIKVGMLIKNTTDGSEGRLLSIDSAIQITHEALTGGSNNDWEVTDTYDVTRDSARFSLSDNGTEHRWFWTPPEGAWAHFDTDRLQSFTAVASAFTKEGIQFYDDGVPVSSALVTHASSAVTRTLTNKITWGSDSAGTGLLYAGEHCESRVYYRALTAEEVRADLNGPISPSTADLVGYWKWNEASGSIIGSEIGAPRNNSIFIDSAGDTGFITDHADLDLSPFTFEALIQTDQGAVADARHNTFAYRDNWLIFRQRSSDDKIVGLIWDGAAFTGVASSTALSPYTNYQVGLSWDGSTLRIYIDGVEEGSHVPTGAPPATNTNLYMFKTAAGTEYFAGHIYETRLWNSIRTEAEQQRWMEDAVVSTDSDLIFLHDYSTQTGTAVADQTGNGRTYSIVSASLWANLDGTITGGDWTSSYEGGSDIQGKRVPTSHGHVIDRDAILVDEDFQIWQVHSDSMEEFETIKFGGVPGTGGGDTDDLPLAVITSGEYKTDLSRGLFRPNLDGVYGPIDSIITVTLKGDNDPDLGGYVETTADVIKRVAIKRLGLVDPTDIDSASFALANTDDPSPVGYATGLSSEKGDVIFDRLATGFTGWWGMTAASLLRINRLPDLPWSSDGQIGDDDLIEIDLATGLSPIWFETLGYEVVWKTLTRSEMLTESMTDEEIEFLSQSRRTITELREDILDDFPRARESHHNTYFDGLGDVGSFASKVGAVTNIGAQKELNRRRGLFMTERIPYRVTIKGRLFEFALGSVYDLTHTRYDLAAGKQVVVLGRKQDGARNLVELLLWG